MSKRRHSPSSKRESHQVTLRDGEVWRCTDPADVCCVTGAGSQMGPPRPSPRGACVLNLRVWLCQRESGRGRGWWWGGRKESSGEKESEGVRSAWSREASSACMGGQGRHPREVPMGAVWQPKQRSGGQRPAWLQGSISAAGSREMRTTGSHWPVLGAVVQTAGYTLKELGAAGEV